MPFLARFPLEVHTILTDNGSEFTDRFAVDKKTKPQDRAPVDVAEDAWSDRGEGQQGSAASAPRLLADDTGPDGDQSPATTRVTLRPHDPATGEEIDKREVVKGYEYARGEFVTFTAEEALGHLVGVGLDPTATVSASHDQPNAGCGSVAEGHRWPAIRLHRGLCVI